MRKKLLSIGLIIVVLATLCTAIFSCTPDQPAPSAEATFDRLKLRGDIYVWDGSAFQKVLMPTSASSLSFKSGGTTVAAGGTATIAHGLGNIPAFAVVSYNGTLTLGATTNITTGIYPRLSVALDATNLTVTMYPAANVTTNILYFIQK